MDENKLPIDKPHDFQLVSPDQKENSMGIYLEYQCTKCKLKGKRYGSTIIRPRKDPEFIWDNFLIIPGEKKRPLMEDCTGIGRIIEQPFMIKIVSKTVCRTHRELKLGGIYVTADTPKHATRRNRLWIFGPKGLVELSIDDYVSYEIKRK